MPAKIMSQLALGAMFLIATSVCSGSPAHAGEERSCKQAERIVVAVGSGLFSLSSCAERFESGTWSLNKETAIKELWSQPNRVVASSLSPVRPYFGFSVLTRNANASEITFDGLTGIGRFEQGWLDILIPANVPGDLEYSINCPRGEGYLIDPKTTFAVCYISVGVPKEEAMLHLSFSNVPHDDVKSRIDLAGRLFNVFHVDQ